MDEAYSDLMVETRGLVKRYGKFTAVDHLDLRVRKGEIYGLLGPNGAGKTTTIKILCGLLKMSGGEAYVDGRQVPDMRISAEIGYMPQETALYLGLTVHQNIAFFGEIFGLSKREIGEREKELLDFIGLPEWRNEIVGNLSGGMKHRVSLACALIHTPPLLLLDEPTVGVDPQLRVSFWSYFNDIKGQGRTIVITTHYMDEAGHCDRIGFMHNGKLIAEGRPDELLSLTETDNLEDAFMSFAGESGRGAER
ncbi:MAG: ABC transporter ATP-binding protein [Actinobacteria bacterium]|nr:ABC transporter ATP-binding protein [Actinomycetota bacterium]